jgi:hypothetical protein
LETVDAATVSAAGASSVASDTPFLNHGSFFVPVGLGIKQVLVPSAAASSKSVGSASRRPRFGGPHYPQLSRGVLEKPSANPLFMQRAEVHPKTSRWRIPKLYVRSDIDLATSEDISPEPHELLVLLCLFPLGERDLEAARARNSCGMLPLLLSDWNKRSWRSVAIAHMHFHA